MRQRALYCRTHGSLARPLLNLLALPEFGLSTVFVVSFISATLLPLGSEPAVFGLIKLNPHLFWPAILVATLPATRWAARWTGGWATAPTRWWTSTGIRPPMCARWPGWNGWAEGLPAVMAACVGDPLCAVAGWLKMPFWPCVGYMLAGKFLRYLVMTCAAAAVPS
jgi:membrane protein YqaA with SNARE-associated domain